MLRVLAIVGAARLRGVNLPTGQGTCLKDALEAKLWLLIGLVCPRGSGTQAASDFSVHFSLPSMRLPTVASTCLCFTLNSADRLIHPPGKIDR